MLVTFLLASSSWVCLQNSQTENDNDSRLGLLGHLDAPYHRYREQGLDDVNINSKASQVREREATYVEPITQNRHDTDGVGCRYNSVWRYTLGVGNSIIPLRFDRRALEYIPKEDDHTPDRDNRQTDMDDPVV